MKNTVLLPAIALVFVAASLDAAPWDFKTQVTAPGSPVYNWFGEATSVSGDMAAVGGPNGNSLSTYLRTGAGWTFGQELTPVGKAGFGNAVDMEGNLMIVGNHYETVGGQFMSGGAFIFERSGNTWTQVAHLTPSDPTANTEFGRSVCIQGNRAVVGATYDPQFGSYAGAAYVFEKQGASWVQTAKLLPTYTTGDMIGFGEAVGLSGNTIAVGAYHDDECGSMAGAAYIFKYNGSSWAKTQKFTGSGIGAWSAFGSSLDLCDNRLVVGAYYTGAGKAFVYDCSGSRFNETQALTASDGAAGDWFGTDVSVCGDRILVGASYDDDCGSNSGSAYLFEKSGATWSQVRKFTAPDGAVDEGFGSGVAVNGYYAAIGSPRYSVSPSVTGKAYFFETTPVPEPATLSMLAAGLLGAGGARILRRARS